MSLRMIYVCTITSNALEQVKLKVKYRLKGHILTWHHGMDNTPSIRKVSDIEYAFATAAAKKANCFNLYINIYHILLSNMNSSPPIWMHGGEPIQRLMTKYQHQRHHLRKIQQMFWHLNFQKLIVNLASGTRNTSTSGVFRSQVDQSVGSKLKFIPTKIIHRAPLFVVSLWSRFEFYCVRVFLFLKERKRALCRFTPGYFNFL